MVRKGGGRTGFPRHLSSGASCAGGSSTARCKEGTHLGEHLKTRWYNAKSTACVLPMVCLDHTCDQELKPL